MMAVHKFHYILLSKQGRRVQVGSVTMNRNEIYYEMRMLHSSILRSMLKCFKDTSFLARILVIRDGDVESNPGPSDIDFIIKKQETLRVKGRPKKSGFKGKFTKKDTGLVRTKPVNDSIQVNDDIQNFIEIKQNSSSLVGGPVGLINYSNDCFFNSVIQALFSLQSFRDHVRNFDEADSHTKDAAFSIKKLFRAIEEIKATSDGPLTTHDYIMAMDLQGYIENDQFDAQECLSYIIDLFYPWANDGNDSDNYGYPDGCLFLFDGEETTLCHRCNYANKSFRDVLCQIAVSEANFENSIQLEFDKIVNDCHGELLDGDNRYVCGHCNPIKTVATRQRTLLNAEKYVIIQLKIFGYNRSMNRGFKIIPDLTIEEEITNILIGTLHLCAIVYHTGDSPDQGHYVCAVKNGDTWYTCNDDQINFGVKLECNPTVKDDLLIPYLLIYEKVHESEVSRQCEIRHAMSVDKPGLSTSQNDEGKDAPHDIGILDMQEKAIKLDREDNTDNFNECNKELSNVSELMKRNLLKELDAQNKRICEIENKKKQRDALVLEINTKSKEIALLKRPKNI
jgi:ubiquitin C-terminal hydrolase